jgi:hypothetical protein
VSAADQKTNSARIVLRVVGQPRCCASSSAVTVYIERYPIDAIGAREAGEPEPLRQIEGVPSWK